jgi:hypothetical protein
MTDYCHPITFGLSLCPSLDHVDDDTRLAQEADAAGLDYIAIQDHAYNPKFLDTWTLITFIFRPNAAAHSQLATFAGDVVPAVRERVSERRATKSVQEQRAYGGAR